MPPLKCYPCVVKRTKPAERRNLNGEKNKEIRKYLVNKLFIRPQEVIEGVTCNKCRLFCGKEIQKKQTTKRKAESRQRSRSRFYSVVRSSSKMLIVVHPKYSALLPSTTASHAQCVVCKRHGPKLVTVPNSARYDLFYKDLLFYHKVQDVALDISQMKFFQLFV
ncbi:MAGT1 [Mytilus coruscus]|uniref:MAGT1 n=1 Tax=Mytilus coruscus TaxID=42192 RepID=A0A6J8CSR3_MYTCO|nr:MAGT1 [Mytilus coruscus]